MLAATHPYDLESEDPNGLRGSAALRDPLPRDTTLADVVGESDSLRYVMSQVDQVAATDATVLLFGETGTGKSCLRVPCIG